MQPLQGHPPGLRHAWRQETHAQKIAGGVILFVLLFAGVVLVTLWAKDWKRYFYFAGDLQSLIIITGAAYLLVHGLLYVMRKELTWALK